MTGKESAELALPYYLETKQFLDQGSDPATRDGVQKRFEEFHEKYSTQDLYKLAEATENLGRLLEMRSGTILKLILVRNARAAIVN